MYRPHRKETRKPRDYPTRDYSVKLTRVTGWVDQAAFDLTRRGQMLGRVSEMAFFLKCICALFNGLITDILCVTSAHQEDVVLNVWETKASRVER